MGTSTLLLTTKSVLIRQNLSAIKSVPVALPPTVPQQAIAKTNPAREVKPKKLASQSPSPKLAANRVWKDPLDQRIAKASTKVHWRMAEAASACDGSLEKLDRKLGKMAREMSRSTL